MRNSFVCCIYCLAVFCMFYPFLGRANVNDRSFWDDSIVELEGVFDNEMAQSLDGETPKWTLETHDGFTYLRGSQNHDYGEGKLLFMCTDKAATLYAFYYAGENTDSIIEKGKLFSLMVDTDKVHQIVPPVRFENKNNWVNALHEIDAGIFDKIIHAHSITYMIWNSLDENRYRGFTIDINSPEQKKLVADYLSECKIQ